MRVRGLIVVPLFVGMISVLPACYAEQASHGPDFFQATIRDAKRAAEVAVQGPNNEFIYLRQPNLECQGAVYENGVLTIFFKKSVGVTWRDGEPKVVPVFAVAGKYRVFVGDNLETEIGNSYSRTFEIVYRPKSSIAADSVRGCLMDGKEI